eukprot:3888236-Pyramimonas_sp.AAC.2
MRQGCGRRRRVSTFKFDRCSSVFVAKEQTSRDPIASILLFCRPTRPRRPRSPPPPPVSAGSSG